MHFVFIPYGARTEVELLFRDMEAQKMKLRLTKKGEKDMAVFIPGQIRLLPFGVVEYVFPREYQDLILNTMCSQNEPNRYRVPKVFRALFRKALKLKKLPKYKTDEKMIWAIEHVSILPLGIREDGNLIEPKDMGYKGWTHESI